MKGSTADPNSFRSILVSETLGKRFHARLRRTLLPRLDTCRLATHAGVSGSMTTAFMTLALRAFQDHMRAARQPHAVLFVDLTAAFYSVLRVFLQSPPPAADLQTQLLSQGLDSHMAEAVEGHVSETWREGQWLKKTLRHVCSTC